MTTRPAWWGNERKVQNRRSAKQEKKRAVETGGRTMAGSGSSWRARQDNRTDEELEQIKYTDKKSFTVKVAECEGIYRDALNAGRDPQMVVDFEQHNIRVVMTIERTR